MGKLFDLINKDTKQQNETKRMTVIIRQLSIIFIILALFNLVLNIALIHSLYGCLLWATMIVADLLTLFMSYNASKQVVITVFVVQKFFWTFSAVMIFGWEGGFQYFLILLMIVYSFGEAGYKKKKLVFNFFGFAMFTFYLVYFKGREGIEDIEGIERIIQISNALAFAIMVSLVSFSFSKDSQLLEDKLMQYNKQLKVEASVDALTGLNNRRSTKEYINDLIKENKIFSICMCDIDHFKRINDTYGHDFGDDVLVAISVVFRKMTDGKGYVARWGGEEFLLVFPDLNGDDAYAEVYKICEEVKKASVIYKDEPVSVTLTYGLTEFDLSKDIENNVKDADEKLYIGKQNGRNQIVY